MSSILVASCPSSQLILSEGRLTSRLIQRTLTNLRLDSTKWSMSHKLKFNTRGGRHSTHICFNVLAFDLRDWECQTVKPLEITDWHLVDKSEIFKPDGDDVCFWGPVDVEPLEADPVLPLGLHHPVVGLQGVHRLQHCRDSADIWVDLQVITDVRFEWDYGWRLSLTWVSAKKSVER